MDGVAGFTPGANDVNYAIVGMPKSIGDACFNLFPYNTPNGDASLDNAINFILHVKTMRLREGRETQESTRET